jgi:hypothetical protein
MKPCISLPILLLPLFAASTQAAQGWYSIGPGDRAVNCILADDTATIFAGTDSGVSVLRNKTWYHVKLLPVKALERVSSTAVAAAAGNGSKSDGIYIGRTIIKGPPASQPPFYTFTIGRYIAAPTALTSQSIIAAAGGPTALLYAANQNSVSSGYIANDTLSTLKPIGISAYAFGAEMPYCTSLRLFGGRLYAGGYDRSAMPGGSCLEYMSSDSFYSLRPMKTTAIAEGRFSSILGSNSQVMAIADVDSGVFFYDKSLGNPWRRTNGPAGAPGSTGAPIRSLHVLPVAGSANDNMLYAATKDGVFQCTPGEPRPVWVKLGTLSPEPFYITSVGSTGELLAATSKGVYRYGEPGTGVLNAGRASARNTVSGKKGLTLATVGKSGAGKIRFDLRGRSIMHTAASELLIDNIHKSVH